MEGSAGGVDSAAADGVFLYIRYGKRDLRKDARWQEFFSALENERKEVLEEGEYDDNGDDDEGYENPPTPMACKWSFPSNVAHC